MKRDGNSSNPRGNRKASAEPVPLDVRVTRLAADVLLVLAAVLAAALLLLWASRAPVFTLRAIALDGDLTHYSVPAIRVNVLPRLAGNYFSINLREAKRAFEAIPWVRRATVRRVWPDRLAVTLEEHRAAAYWVREDAEDQLVNQQGEVFEVNLGDVEDEVLPLLSGPEGSSAQVWDMYLRLMPVFDPVAERVQELSLSMRGSWRASLNSGATLELGRGTADEVVARTQRFASTVGQVAARYRRDGRSIEYADLRHHDAYALRLRGVGTVRDGDSSSARNNPNNGRR